MKNRFYLLTLAFAALTFVSQAKAVMPDDDPLPGEGGGESTDTVATDTIVPVAIVNGETPFASLDHAFYSSTDSTVTNIQPVDDVHMGMIYLKKGVTVTLDLNGHGVTIDSLGIYNYGTLTITDSSEGKTGSMTLDHGNVSLIYNYGDLTIDNGVFTNSSAEEAASDSRRCLITFAGSKTHIKDGQFTSNGQAMLLAGETVIDAGHYTTYGNCEVVANYCTDQQLVINGGTFSNQGLASPDNDLRRCLWTGAGTSTLIKDGTFESGSRVLYLLGSATIDGGSFTTKGNRPVVSNLSLNGDVTINGGTFTNHSEVIDTDKDQRYCLVSYQGTRTAINGGTFTSVYQVLVLNGNATISDGEFVTTGNINVVGNFNVDGELLISGGAFRNECVLPEDADVVNDCRCLWANNNTTTTITGGTFINNATAQTIAVFNAKAFISGGTITNLGHGSGVATNGTVEISGCRISAWNMFICWPGGTMVCSGGLFSETIPTELLAEGYQCVSNTDPATMETYPYKVVKGMPGDVNGDGSVDVADIANVIDVMARSGNDEQADVNGDGSVDVADIANVISIMAEQ